MLINNELQDLTYLQWSKIRNSSGTAGSFLKAYSDFNGKKIYYKLSNFDTVNGIVGHECINEIIVDRLLTILGIEHLSYSLLRARILIDDKEYITYLCSSEDFKERGESKLALDVYYQAERKRDETMLQFCQRNDWEDYIYTMLVVDFLILNRDRHGANLEVLRSRTKKTIRLAPLFDHGLSLIFSCHTDKDVEEIKAMDDRSIQCCVGSHSAKKNLELIPKDKLPHLKPLKETDREALLEGLDLVLPKLWLDKIWEMLWSRYCYYEDFCHQR